MAKEAHAHLVVLYNPPTDAAHFEQYYTATHLPLLFKYQQQIGFSHAKFTKFESTLDGKPATLYRKAELTFPSLAALKTGVATPEFGQVAKDLGNFASGGLTPLIGVETHA
jgi:uncharacterized protein (TIGR02118 family)